MQNDLAFFLIAYSTLTCFKLATNVSLTVKYCYIQVRTVNPKDVRERKPTQLFFVVKLLKASNSLKQASLVMYTGCLSLKCWSRNQHSVWGRQGFYSSGVEGLHLGSLKGKMGGFTGTEHKHNRLIVRTSGTETLLQGDCNKVTRKSGQPLWNKSMVARWF